MSNKIEYPCLMESTIKSRVVVCFSSETVGHAIDVKDATANDLYSDDWEPATNTKVWKPYMPPLYEDGEICWVWDEGDNGTYFRRYDAKNRKWCFMNGERNGSTWKYHAKFKGTLPVDLPKIKD